MTSKYAKALSIPGGFSDVLRDLTREILRQQPADINAFAHQYFADAVAARDAAPADERVATKLSPEELQQLVMQLFIQADADQSGYLDHGEFKNVLKSVQEELDLSRNDVLRLASEADEDGDGIINYTEFVPTATELIQSLFAKRDFAETEAQRQAEAEADAQDYLLHGMPRDELEALLKDVFIKADADGSGALGRKEFAKCIRESELGLTRKEINALMMQVDADGDGQVSYDEFVPLCFNILVQIVSEEFKDDSIPKDEDELRNYLTDLFASADADKGGVLLVGDMKHLVTQADLGLSRVQIHAVLSEAEMDINGFVDYAAFAQTAAGLIATMIDFQVNQANASRLGEIRASDEYQRINGLDQEGLAASVSAAIAAADPAAAQQGMTSRVAFVQALDSLAGSASFSSQQINVLKSLGEPDDAGNIYFDRVLSDGFACLQGLQQVTIMRG